MRLIVWFCRDLRVHDHAALWQACKDADETIPVFILDPTILQKPETGKGAHVTCTARSANLFRGAYG